MGEEDVKRRFLNVFRMELWEPRWKLTDGSHVVLKDVVNAAFG